MSNIRKSFSFRNGIQVDNEVLVVSGALVGIGTTIPTEKLDIQGTAKVVGLATLQSLYVSNTSNFNSDVTIGNSITAQSSTGVITATAFYGNGATLSNLPTSQWVDVDVGLGFTSIYAQGNVGISTNSPLSTFQVGGNPNNFQNGVGISSNGDIIVSGVITSRSFIGFGSDITLLRGENITIGTISNSVLPIINNDRLPSDINVTGVVTAQSGFVGNITGNVVGIASTARSLTGTPNIIVGIITSTQINATSIAATSINLVGGVVSAGVSVGILTVSQTLQVLSGSNELNFASGRLGIGTNTPTTDVQIKKNTNTTLEVLSNTGEARISVGQSVGVGNSNGVIRFGSSPSTFELVNKSIGDFNYYLHAGSVSGINTGGFNWIYGQTNQRLMSLTYDGKLGIGKTDPTNQLHVQGISTVTGNAWFGSNIYVSDTVNARTIILSDPLTTNLSVTTGISTFNNIQAVKIGIETSDPLTAIDARSGILLIDSIGIGTTVPNSSIDVRDGTILVKSVGVGTTSLYVNPITDFSPEIQTHDKFIGLYDGGIGLYGSNSVGFNTDLPRSILDFGMVGLAATISGYFIAPTVTTTNRNQFSNNTGIGGTVEGAIIYNSTTKKHQGYGSTNGGVTFTWNDLY